MTANLAGIPAISVPVGEVDGLPIGGQLMGPRWREDALVRVARALEASIAPGSSGGEAVRTAPEVRR